MSTGDPSARSRAAIADAGARQVALVYAKALLGAAQSAGQPEAVLQEFDSFLADVLGAFPDWEKVLSSRLVSADDKAAMLERVLGGRASPLFLNFLKVLARHERLDCLGPIHRAAHDLYQEQLGRVSVQVSTAAPLDEALAARIAETVRRMVGREPKLMTQTDPALIGGMVLRIGDTVYDASISSRLEQTRAQMINRSIHEIQSRRDRFRHPAGN